MAQSNSYFLIWRIRIYYRNPIIILGIQTRGYLIEFKFNRLELRLIMSDKTSYSISQMKQKEKCIGATGAALPTPREPHRKQRWCAICGVKMRAYPSTLSRHCLRQHGGDNHGFIEEGQQPKASKYLNDGQLEHDPHKTLLEDFSYPMKLAGRPRNRDCQEASTMDAFDTD